MKKYGLLIIWCCLWACQAKETPTQTETEIKVEKTDFDSTEPLKASADMLFRAVQQHQDSTTHPRTVNEDGSLRAVRPQDWTSGFFAGNLWQLYEHTGDSLWRIQAQRWTASLDSQKFNNHTHDLGFMMYCSFGQGFHLTGDEAYRETLIQSAKTLISRYNANVGCIRSWDFSPEGKEWLFPVIIDNMMNLELLFWATESTGDSSFYNIAVNHAVTTMENHFREDNSTWHVVDYDPSNGAVRWKGTHQGYDDNSSWARGQAWGLYGYTLTYRETKEDRFLEQSKKIAEYILNHPALPEDLVPYWDYNDPEIPNAPMDASAAAITASALLELGEYVMGTEQKKYWDAAEKILESLSSPSYFSKKGENQNFILTKSTGNKPGNSEVSVPLVYADYYYLEALRRYKKLQENGAL